MLLYKINKDEDEDEEGARVGNPIVVGVEADKKQKIGSAKTVVKKEQVFPPPFPIRLACRSLPPVLHRSFPRSRRHILFPRHLSGCQAEIADR